MEEEPVNINNNQGNLDEHTIVIRNKRLFNELNGLIENPPNGIAVTYDRDDIISGDISRWVCYVTGPDDSAYEGITYQVNFYFPTEYPFSPPIVRFVTPIFHPNICSDGSVKITGLEDLWTPAMLSLIHI